MLDLQAILNVQLSEETPVLLIGDFNFVKDPVRDRSNHLNRDPPSATIM